jgi:hypothetical protein
MMKILFRVLAHAGVRLPETIERIRLHQGSGDNSDTVKKVKTRGSLIPGTKGDF